MTKNILCLLFLGFLPVYGYAQTTSSSIFFNENRANSSARNWAIRQNNSHDGDLQIGTGNTNTSGLPDFSTSSDLAKMTISNSGNVGIGTTTPQFKLEVAGWGHFAGRLSQSAAVANDNNAAFANTDATGYGLYSLGGAGTHYAFHFLNQAGQTVLYGKGDGNIGIGTNTPQYKLDVNGSGNFTGRLSQSGAIANDNNAAFTNSDATGYGLYSRGGASTHYVFHFLNQASESILYGRADGNVGIGTSNPDKKLTVKGVIHAQEIQVDMTVPGPDYVFEPTYNLQPLSEVESYIKENKHLPEVPSAKQMEEEGLNLKEMNLILLKKMEELTLHLIEQQKEIDELKKAVRK